MLWPKNYGRAIIIVANDASCRVKITRMGVHSRASDGLGSLDRDYSFAGEFGGSEELALIAGSAAGGVGIELKSSSPVKCLQRMRQISGHPHR